MPTSMKREDFLAKLQLLAPALAPANSPLPVLTHFWFTGTQVMAYNDHIGISTPLKTEFKGAVPGKLLLDLLRSSLAETLDFSTKGAEMTIKTGGSDRWDIAMMDVAEFPFQMPKSKDDGGFLSAAFLTGLEGCMRSVNNDTSVPDQLGVSLLPEKGNKIALFATNNATLSHAMASGKFVLKSRVCLPSIFCTQLLEIDKEAERTLELGDNYALAVIGVVTLYGRLVDVPRPLKFWEMLDRHLPEAMDRHLVDIPDALMGILDRASLVTETQRASTRIYVEDGATMKFFAKDEINGHEVRATIKLKKHPNVDTDVDAKALRAGLGHFDKMLIVNDCAIFTKGEAIYLVASRGA